MDEHQPQTLRGTFASFQSKLPRLENYSSTVDQNYQDLVRAGLSELEQCRQLISSASLFSRNEDLSDIASQDLPFLLVEFYLGDFHLKQNTGERKKTLLQSQSNFNDYLERLGNYFILSKNDSKLYELFLENKNDFSATRSGGATERREQKIRRYKEEKELKGRLEILRQVPSAVEQDDEAVRDLYMSEISLATHQTFQYLESISQELKILALRPPSPGPNNRSAASHDGRKRQGDQTNGAKAYSDRLDPSLRDLLKTGKAGPILDKQGKPLRPFTLLDNRQRMQANVFGPGHSLPTMTIDEYLEEEEKRGAFIKGGGENSGMKPAVDEDDYSIADAATMKARDWDEFVEENPKGSGNTLNRG